MPMHQGVVGLVTSTMVDVLSHAAVRARNCGVFLAASYNAEELDKIRAFDGKQASLTMLQVTLACFLDC